MDKRTRRKTDGGEVAWSYRKSMEEGSEELRSIITLITAGWPPGFPIHHFYKEGKNREQGENHQ